MKSMALRAFLVTVLSTAIAIAARTAWSHDSEWILGGYGTATIDGVLSPGEWTVAGSKTFDVNVPVADGGGTIPATMFVMNDASNLYVAFRIQRGTLGAATNPAVFFDNDHDLAREAGDDGIGMGVGVFAPAEFFDTFVDGDGHTVSDSSFGGTDDGTTAATADGSSTYIEMSHPLDTLDDAHDFSLSGGEVIGFGVLMNLFGTAPECTPNEIGSPCQAFTPVAGSFTDPRGDIFVLSPSPGLCESSAVEARRVFVDACIAAGGTPASCNRAGAEILVNRLEDCRAP